jgi:hypothetical protein
MNEKTKSYHQIQQSHPSSFVDITDLRLKEGFGGWKEAQRQGEDKGDFSLIGLRKAFFKLLYTQPYSIPILLNIEI